MWYKPYFYWTGNEAILEEYVKNYESAENSVLLQT